MYDPKMNELVGTLQQENNTLKGAVASLRAENAQLSKAVKVARAELEELTAPAPAFEPLSVAEPEPELDFEGFDPHMDE